MDSHVHAWRVPVRGCSRCEERRQEHWQAWRVCCPQQVPWKVCCKIATVRERIRLWPRHVSCPAIWTWVMPGKSWLARFWDRTTTRNFGNDQYRNWMKLVRLQLTVQQTTNIKCICGPSAEQSWHFLTIFDPCSSRDDDHSQSHPEDIKRRPGRSQLYQWWLRMQKPLERSLRDQARQLKFSHTGMCWNMSTCWGQTWHDAYARIQGWWKTNSGLKTSSQRTWRSTRVGTVSPRIGVFEWKFRGNLCMWTVTPVCPYSPSEPSPGQDCACQNSNCTPDIYVSNTLKAFVFLGLWIFMASSDVEATAGLSLCLNSIMFGRGTSWHCNFQKRFDARFAGNLSRG